MRPFMDHCGRHFGGATPPCRMGGKIEPPSTHGEKYRWLVNASMDTVIRVFESFRIVSSTCTGSMFTLILVTDHTIQGMSVLWNVSRAGLGAIKVRHKRRRRRR